MPTEADPLLPLLVSDEEPTKQLRDRVTTQYTTIALVSALLSGARASFASSAATCARARTPTHACAACGEPARGRRCTRSRCAQQIVAQVT